jgi:hypothetical protein
MYIIHADYINGKKYLTKLFEKLLNKFIESETFVAIVA